MARFTNLGCLVNIISSEHLNPLRFLFILHPLNPSSPTASLGRPPHRVSPADGWFRVEGMGQGAQKTCKKYKNVNLCAFFPLSFGSPTQGHSGHVER